jgi:hypothetical protein
MASEMKTAIRHHDPSREAARAATFQRDGTRQAAVQATLAMVVRERERVLDLLAGEFRRMPLVDRERCVDTAFDELYADGRGELLTSEVAFRAQWIKRARWRAYDECRLTRFRRRERASLSEPQVAERVAAENPAEPDEGLLDELEARRAQYRAAELLALLTPQQRLVAEAIFDAAPGARPRDIRAKLGWGEARWGWHRKELAKHLRALLSPGALCEHSRERLEEYIRFSLETRAAAAGLCPASEASAERFRALWLHLEHCPACHARARELNRIEGAVQHALCPPALLLGACAVWLHDMAALAKAKTIGAAAAVAPARVRVAGTGGGATSAALSGLTGKAVVCAGAALCAAVGLVGSEAVPLLAHHRSPSQSRPNVVHVAVVRRAPTRQPLVSVSVPAPAAPRVYAVRPARAPSRPQRAAPLVLEALHTGTAPPLAHLATRPAKSEAAEDWPPRESAAPAHLPAPERSAGESQPNAGSAGCETPGDLGC